MSGREVDIDGFLARPLIARVATPGPTLRPVWYLWEDGSFWWLSDTGNYLLGAVEAGEPLVVLVDACDLETGEVIAVTARGEAEVLPLDVELATRKLRRYLGDDATKWDPRFAVALEDLPTTRLVRLTPTKITAKDMSYDT